MANVAVDEVVAGPAAQLRAEVFPLGRTIVRRPSVEEVTAGTAVDALTQLRRGAIPMVGEGQGIGATVVGISQERSVWRVDHGFLHLGRVSHTLLDVNVHELLLRRRPVAELNHDAMEGIPEIDQGDGPVLEGAGRGLGPELNVVVATPQAEPGGRIAEVGVLDLRQGDDRHPVASKGYWVARPAIREDPVAAGPAVNLVASGVEAAEDKIFEGVGRGADIPNPARWVNGIEGAEEREVAPQRLVVAAAPDDVISTATGHDVVARAAVDVVVARAAVDVGVASPPEDDIVSVTAPQDVVPVENAAFQRLTV